MSAALQNQENFIPLQDFFKNPTITDFQVSRNNLYIAYRKPWQQRMNVFVRKLSAERLPVGEEKQITFVKDRNVFNYLWKGDDVIVYSKDFGGDENFHEFSVDINTGKEIDLTPFPNTRTHVMDRLTEVSETDVLIESNKRDATMFDVYRANVYTGEIRMVAENKGGMEGWVADHTGQVRAAIQNDGLITKVWTRATEQEDFKVIIEYDFKSTFYPLFFTFDNKQLYACSNLKRDKVAIVKIDPVSGAELEVIFEHPEVDAQSLGYSRKRKVITDAIYTTWKHEHKFLDAEHEQIYSTLAKHLGVIDISLPSMNKNEDLFIVCTYSDKTRGNYYLYDAPNDKLTLLYDFGQELVTDKLASMQPVKYTSRDGLTIHGYLTLPLNSSGKNLPIVVNPHGGPWARDVWSYEAEVQFLANRGYAVFQMNFRGSTGYGKEFFSKGFKQWGRTMQHDITDGVEWLIEQGIADPKRIAIYGCSYGGYATLAAITLTPNLYACAIDFVGVSNLFTFMNTAPPYWESYLAKLKAMVGDPETEKEYLLEVSPVQNADKIVTPLFVAQGAKDPRVNINESDQIVNSLRQRGVEVKYMVKENEGHGFHNEENRFEFYAEMEKFLVEHIG